MQILGHNTSLLLNLNAHSEPVYSQVIEYEVDYVQSSLSNRHNNLLRNF